MVMDKVILSKDEAVEVSGGKPIDVKDVPVTESHVISSTGKILKGVGMKNPDPKTVKAGIVKIFDGDTLVIEIDKIALATAISAIVAADEVDGVKMVYKIQEAMISIGYEQKDQLTAKGNYNDLIFYFSEKKR